MQDIIGHFEAPYLEIFLSMEEQFFSHFQRAITFDPSIQMETFKAHCEEFYEDFPIQKEWGHKGPYTMSTMVMKLVASNWSFHEKSELILISMPSIDQIDARFTFKQSWSRHP